MKTKKTKKTTASQTENPEQVASNTPKSTPAIVITMIPVNQVQPNPWNPNEMSDEAYEALRDEVKAQGKIPKPIVVYRENSIYRIVDGEHACRAAKEIGLAEIPCEIIEVDRFEAMRQTLARNIHGENNPVKLGRLYQRMLKEGKLKNRQLAELLHVTEGTIRNYLNYAKAAELRNGYAPKGGDEQISSLKVKQVTAYLELPKGQRDEWLDAGANLEKAAELMTAKASAKRKAEAQPKATPAEESNANSDAGHVSPAEADADSELPTDGDAQHDPEPQTTPTDATSTTTDDEEKTFDQDILDELEDAWENANMPTRKEFIAGIMANPDVLTVTRRMIKQAS